MFTKIVFVINFNLKQVKQNNLLFQDPMCFWLAH